MTIAEKIAELKAAGIVTVEGIERALSAVPVTRTPVSRPRDPALVTLEKQYKAACVPDLMNAGQWDVADATQRDARIDNTLAQRMGRAGITDAEWVALAKLESNLRLLRRRIERSGGTATGSLAGADNEAGETVTYGQSFLESNGLSMPTMHRIREELSK